MWSSKCKQIVQRIACGVTTFHNFLRKLDDCPFMYTFNIFTYCFQLQ
jgi:hypothetical protein